jgi:hypothetical protein
MSQKHAVLEYLENYDAITPLKAQSEFGAYRLASIIHRLRNDGHKIVTVMRRSYTNKPFAEYHLSR